MGGHSHLLAPRAIWEGTVWEDFSYAYLDKQDCTGTIFPTCLQKHAGKGVFNFYCSHIDVPTVGTSQRPKTVLLSKYYTFNSLSEIVSWSNGDCAASHMVWGGPEASSIQRTLSQGRSILPSPQLSQWSQHMSFHKMAELSLPLC